MTKYTMANWDNDGEFAAQPMQEIDGKIYDEMFEMLPPLTVSRLDRDALEAKTGKRLSDSFCMGEAYSFDGRGYTYLAFGKIDNKCYYLGKQHAA